MRLSKASHFVFLERTWRAEGRLREEEKKKKKEKYCERKERKNVNVQGNDLELVHVLVGDLKIENSVKDK